MRDLHKGNLDLAVLRSKIPARVTPWIAQMAVLLFREVLQVVGPCPPAEPEVPKDNLTDRFQGFLIRTQSQRRRLVQFRPRILLPITFGKGLYHVLATSHPSFGQVCQDHVHERIGDCPCSMFEHRSKAILPELGHTQELFLVNQCDTQALGHTYHWQSEYTISSLPVTNSSPAA